MEDKYKNLFIILLNMRNKILTNDKTILNDIKLINEVNASGTDFTIDKSTVINILRDVSNEITETYESLLFETIELIDVPNKKVFLLETKLRLAKSFENKKNIVREILDTELNLDGLSEFEIFSFYNHVVHVAIFAKDNELIEKAIKKLDSFK